MAVNFVPHPRTLVVTKAAREFNSLLTDLQARHGLTHAELLKVVSSELSTIASVAIVEEREAENSNKEKP